MAQKKNNQLNIGQMLSDYARSFAPQGRAHPIMSLYDYVMKQQPVQDFTALAKTVGSHIDPSNQQTPVLGPIRKAMSSTPLGRPDYANPELPMDKRISNALQLYGESFMGSHGGLGGVKPKAGVAQPLAKKKSR